MDCSSLHISMHAFKRMVSRNISPTKLAQIMSCGQIYSEGSGCYKAKLWQRIGKNEVCYNAVFSKKTNTIVTVWVDIKPHTNNFLENIDNLSSRHKIYKKRKRVIREQEFDSYCREELRDYRIRFAA